MKCAPPDDGISAVLAVVLMVAITVILAGFLGPYLSNITTNVPQNYIITTNAKWVDNDGIAVTFVGGRDARMVTNLSVVINDTYVGTIGKSNGSQLTVGSTTIFSPAPFGLPSHSFVKNSHVVVVANFIDGTSQVVLNSFVA